MRCRARSDVCTIDETDLAGSGFLVLPLFLPLPRPLPPAPPAAAAMTLAVWLYFFSIDL